MGFVLFFFFVVMAGSGFARRGPGGVQRDRGDGSGVLRLEGRGTPALEELLLQTNRGRFLAPPPPPLSCSIIFRDAPCDLVE